MERLKYIVPGTIKSQRIESLLSSLIGIQC